MFPKQLDALVKRMARPHWLALALATLALGSAGAALAASTGGTAPDSARAGRTVSSKIVKKVQRKLGVRPVSGYYGPLTRRAVRRFQRRRGLRASGALSARTLRALGLRGRTGRSDRTGTPVRLPRVLRRIARCESGGNPRAISPDGRYRGKFQFSRATWRSVGGTGDPAAAPEAEQDRRALKLYRREGTAPWPNCA